ncbi:MAG: membrane dipeptidase [Acidobacteria bacterium]|nr:membrane dipeptidase [Acidobacteriota bacterium]
MPNLRRGVFVMLIFALSAPIPRAAERPPEEAEKVAQRVLERALVIDLHSDTTQMMLDEGYDLAEPDSLFMVSIPKMRKGRLGAAFFSVWVSVDWPKGNIVQRALDQIDVIHEQAARHSDALGLAATADDIVRLHGRNKIAILMGLEGGHAIRKDLRLLNIYYRLGVRYMTLTHTAHTDWAESSGQKTRGKGLTDFGDRLALIVSRSVGPGAQHDRRDDSRPGEKRRRHAHQLLLGLSGSHLRRGSEEGLSETQSGIRGGEQEIRS